MPLFTGLQPCRRSALLLFQNANANFERCRYLHQLLLADTYQPFDEPCGPGLTVFLISFIGFGFTGPAYLAFHNDIPMSTAAALATMYLFVLGACCCHDDPPTVCLQSCVVTQAAAPPRGLLSRHLKHVTHRAGSAVNVAADFYKAGAKDAGAGLVTTGPYRLAIRINYFGGLMVRAPQGELSGPVHGVGTDAKQLFCRLQVTSSDTAPSRCVRGDGSASCCLYG